MEVEIVTISKELLNCKYDQNIYCFRQVVFTKGLRFLFVLNKYLVYHREFDFSLSQMLALVKHVIELELCK